VWVFYGGEQKPITQHQHTMATLSERFFKNVPGRFYNDESCIDCGLCPDLAPQFFRRDDESGQTYVWSQPSTPAEVDLAMEAVEACPTESIGHE
jgi:ferredoxin